MPMDADSPKFKTTSGSCKYAPDQNAVVWTIKSFPVSVSRDFITCYSRDVIVDVLLFAGAFTSVELKSVWKGFDFYDFSKSENKC